MVCLTKKGLNDYEDIKQLQVVLGDYYWGKLKFKQKCSKLANDARDIGESREIDLYPMDKICYYGLKQEYYCRKALEQVMSLNRENELVRTLRKIRGCNKAIDEMIIGMPLLSIVVI